MLPDIVNGQELCELLGISRTRITQMVKEGMPKQARGKYDLKACVQWYLDKRLTGGSKTADLNDARKKLYESQREKTDLETARIRRQLIPAEEVAHAIHELTSIYAAQLEGVGGRLAGELAGITEEGRILERLTDETRLIRGNVADLVQTFADTYDSSDDSKTAAEA